MCDNNYVLVGLGNPGLSDIIRHNTGFLFLDFLAEKYNTKWVSEKYYKHCVITFNNNKITLVKPYENYNVSGNAVNDALYDCGLFVDNLIVVHDDVDIPFCSVRVKKGGSSGGCNGIKSIDEVLSTNMYSRIRIGIGRPESGKVTGDWVCGDFSSDELKELKILFAELEQKLSTMDNFDISSLRNIIKK